MSTRLFAAVCLSAICGVAAADVGRVTYTGTRNCQNGQCQRVSSIGTAFTVGTAHGRTIWIGPGHGVGKVGDRVSIDVYGTGKKVTARLVHKEASKAADVAIMTTSTPARWSFSLRAPQVNQRVRVFGYPQGVTRRHSFVSSIERSGYRSFPYRVRVPGNDELATGYSGGPVCVTDQDGRHYCLGSIWGGDGVFTPGDVLRSRVRQISQRRVVFQGTPSPAGGDDFTPVDNGGDDGDDDVDIDIDIERPNVPTQLPVPYCPCVNGVPNGAPILVNQAPPGVYFLGVFRVPIWQRQTEWRPQIRYVPRVEYDTQVQWQPVETWRLQ